MKIKVRVINKKPTEKDRVREAAEDDLVTFIKLVAPKQVLGHCHERMLQWWTRQGAKSHQLLLWPRDHQKSRMVAYRVAWEITRHPWWRFLYISSTANLAEKQLRLIKGILTSPIYRKYWPEMVNTDEGKREKWTNSEISVDHPRRKEEGVAESTVFTGGLTTSLTGFHCEVAICDDLVVKENAFSGEGREKVKSQYSLLSSIETTDSLEWVVGTRYDPNDLYSDMIKMEMDTFNDEGNIDGKVGIFEIQEEVVEDSVERDGTGQYLWALQTRPDGRKFGFNKEILAKKRGQYLDKAQFFAQYYNDPNDPQDKKDFQFQYYDKKHLDRTGGNWFFKDRRLNVFASVDFAYSLSRRSDYTAIVVIGIDCERNIYVLDIDRFKTMSIADYYQHILDLHTKWDFKKLAAEVSAGQAAIVSELKNAYIRPNGLYLSIVEIKPNSRDGKKEERIDAILSPRYSNNAIWHYQGGNCQVLEEELMSSRPPHDDVKDALATAVDISIPPTGGQKQQWNNGQQQKMVGNVIYNARFGGVSF